jgi:hypothetical protein
MIVRLVDSGHIEKDGNTVSLHSEDIELPELGGEGYLVPIITRCPTAVKEALFTITKGLQEINDSDL